MLHYMQWQEFRSRIRHLSAPDLSRIERAFSFGKSVHEGQKRKSGEPYFTHPVAVAHMLSDLGADADTLIAALLHDSVEDTPLTLEEINHEFDGSVSSLIDGVTKLGAKDVAMSPKLDEQIETLRKMFNLMQQDVRIMVIKLIDRLHNIQTVEFLKAERQQSLAQETLETFVKIADKLCMQDLRDELEGLCLAILEPDLYPKLTEIRLSNEQRGNHIIAEMREHFRTYDKILASHIQLLFEYKSWEQLKAQLSVGGAAATGLSSLTVALVCDDIDTCYRAMGALHQLWKREVLSFQDFINAPQLNGYQGLHTTVIFRDGTRIRCKIRTKAMQEYARKGVTTACFKGVSEFAEILPWTKNISSLTKGTEGSSNDFWESLKNEILGESIIIHGPADETVQLPKGATALDGAFHLFRENALSIRTILIDGRESAFSTPLSNAVTIDAEFADSVTARIDWLQVTRTTTAAAFIRTALTQVPEKDQITLGRELLQRELTRHHRGFLEEFNLETLREKLAIVGYRYPSFEKIYIAIAEGRLDAKQAYRVLFEANRSPEESRKQKQTISYSLDLTDLSLMDKVNEIHRRYAVEFNEIRYKRDERLSTTAVKLKVSLSEDQLASLLMELRTTGAKHLKTRRSLLDHALIIIAIIVLWGMDTIFAKMLLNAGFTPSSLTFVRSWTSFVVASVIILGLRQHRKTSFIPLRNPAIWVAGFSFFLVSFLTYWMLESSSPFFYKTMLRVSALLIGLPILFSKRSYAKIGIATLLTVVGLAMLFKQLSGVGFLISVSMILSFSLYTWTSEYFQKTARIDIRYPQFFFIISVISAVSSLPLAFLLPMGHPSLSLVLLAIAFTLVFVCLPYILFYILNRVTDYLTLAPLFHMSIPITFFGEWLLLGINDVWIIPAALLLIAASMIASDYWRTHTIEA